MDDLGAPWSVGPYARDVWGDDEKRGAHKICDISGWGYLTGKGLGALGLSHDEAIAIQTVRANVIAAAPDMLAALEAQAEADDFGDQQGFDFEDWTRLEEKARELRAAALSKAKGAL